MVTSRPGGACLAGTPAAAAWLLSPMQRHSREKACLPQTIMSSRQHPDKRMMHHAGSFQHWQHGPANVQRSANGPLQALCAAEPASGLTRYMFRCRRQTGLTSAQEWTRHTLRCWHQAAKPRAKSTGERTCSSHSLVSKADRAQMRKQRRSIAGTCRCCACLC